MAKDGVNGSNCKPNITKIIRIPNCGRGLDPMSYKASTPVDMTRHYPSEAERASQEDYREQSKQYTVDFLTAVRKHVYNKLDELYFFKDSGITLEWMITVPAIWSSEAKDITKECASAAGMGSINKLLMTSEPEAAANHSLDWLKSRLTVGMKIMVLDAGGGTVDLITYTVKQLEPFQVEESGVCSGGKCGGVFVNRSVTPA
jgi:hypothetical protein